MRTSSIARRAYAIDGPDMLRFNSLDTFDKYVMHTKKQLTLITRDTFSEAVSRVGRTYQWVGTRFSGMKRLEWRSA